MVCMVLTPLGVVPLGVWSVQLSWPSDSVTHILHDGYNLNWLYIEVVLWQPIMVNRCCRPVVRLGRLMTKWTPSLSCESSRWRGVRVRVVTVRTPIWRLEVSLWTSLLTPAIMSRPLGAVELIFFPTDLNPCLGKNILHGGAVELGQLFVELPVREESLLETVDDDFLVAERNGDFLTVEASNIVAE